MSALAPACAADLAAVVSRESLADSSVKEGSRALFGDGFALLQSGEFQAATRLYAEGLALDPANGPAHYFYGLALAGLGNESAARAQYELTVRLAPDSTEGLIAKGILRELDEHVSATLDGCW
jgi:tetratricopeptide (TPR) repeat protein